MPIRMARSTARKKGVTSNVRPHTPSRNRFNRRINRSDDNHQSLNLLRRAKKCMRFASAVKKFGA